MQCSDKGKGIFINEVTVQIKATTFGHAHHHLNIVHIQIANYIH